MPSATAARIADLDIRAVWQALGGGPIRHGRGRAFWRDGEGHNIALNREQGFWHDFVTGQGGGILRLVEVALGVDRRGALRWLAESFGVATGGNYPAVDRRAYGQRIEAARKLAVELVERRDSYLSDLRCAAQILLEEYYQLLNVAEAEHNIEMLARADDIFAKQQEICARRERFAKANGPELVTLFAAVEGGVA